MRSLLADPAGERTLAVGAWRAGWQARPERDAEIVPAMPPALLVLVLLAIACSPAPAPDGPPGGGTEGSRDGDTGGEGPGGQGHGDGSTGASVTFERLDAGGDCAGLVPERAPSPVTLRRPADAGESCLGGVSDGTGAVALGLRGASGGVSWRVHAPDGAAGAAFVADPPLVPEPSGWHALVSTGPQGTFDPTVAHVAFGPDGAVVHRERITPDPGVAVYPRWHLSPDPAGGCLVTTRSSALGGNHWSSVAAARFDAGGRPAWPGGSVVTTDTSASEPMFLAGGVSVRGEVMVVSQDSAFLDVSWLDARTGAVLAGASADQGEPSAPVVGETLQPALELVPLLDGSLALRADARFRRAYGHLAAASSPLPAWLAERAAFTLRFTRGNAGYAAFPPGGQSSPDCTQRIDLVSPGGRLCGRVVLREEGSGCTTGAVDQGWDGTVVQQSGKDACAYHVWRGLLGR